MTLSNKINKIDNYRPITLLNVNNKIIPYSLSKNKTNIAYKYLQWSKRVCKTWYMYIRLNIRHIKARLFRKYKVLVDGSFVFRFHKGNLPARMAIYVLFFKQIWLSEISIDVDKYLS